VRLLILSDTHVPKRARELPAQVWAAATEADVVVHAGDWIDVPLLDELEQRTKRVVAVYGNNDGPELRARLPEVAHVELDGLRVVVVHETGTTAGRARRLDARFASEADVVIFGHSHVPYDETTPAGLRLLNPGSPTDRRRQPVATYMTARVEGGRLLEVELVPVAKPG
jgi:putative phosphoesterase